MYYYLTRNNTVQMTRGDRDWMYDRWIRNGMVTNDYLEGVEEFITFAQQHNEGMVDGKIRCPCKKKENARIRILLDADTIRNHLYKKWFRERVSYLEISRGD